MKRFAAVLSFLVVLGSMALNAQTILTNTTLSTALTTTSGTVLTLTSATGVNAPNTTDPTKATFLYIDRELMGVTAVSGTTINVSRGVAGTVAASHISGAVVYVVPNYEGTWFQLQPPQGSCTRGQGIAQYLPVLSVTYGVFSDCNGGQWVNSFTWSQTTRQIGHYLMSPAYGALNDGAALGTSTVTVAAELYCTEIDVPNTKLFTGLGFHMGATGNGTDKWISALYDSSGVLLANSALAGTAPSGTNYVWAQLPFTSPYLVVGPSVYYGCFMSNGTGDYADLIKTAYGEWQYTYKSGSAGTFGTLPSFTAPTQFTTVNGPFLYLY
jgi:hypothetical protein